MINVVLIRSPKIAAQEDTRLARYYREEGGADAVLIDLPKGGFTPVFKTREAAPGGRTIAAQRYVSPIEFASVRFALGQRELGFTSLDKSCEDRAFDVLALKVDPRFDAEKHDPRMQAILRIVGLA